MTILHPWLGVVLSQAFTIREPGCLPDLEPMALIRAAQNGKRRVKVATKDRSKIKAARKQRRAAR